MRFTSENKNSCREFLNSWLGAIRAPFLTLDILFHHRIVVLHLRTPHNWDIPNAAAHKGHQHPYAFFCPNSGLNVANPTIPITRLIHGASVNTGRLSRRGYPTNKTSTTITI